MYQPHFIACCGLHHSSRWNCIAKFTAQLLRPVALLQRLIHKTNLPSALVRQPTPANPSIHTIPTQYALTSALVLVFTPSPHRFVPEFTNTHTHTHYSPAPEVMIFSRVSTRNACKAPGRVLHTMRLPRTTLLARSPPDTNPANDAYFRSKLNFR